MQGVPLRALGSDVLAELRVYTREDTRPTALLVQWAPPRLAWQSNASVVYASGKQFQFLHDTVRWGLNEWARPWPPRFTQPHHPRFLERLASYLTRTHGLTCAVTSRRPKLVVLGASAM